MAINQYLPFATSTGANVEGYTAWAADTDRMMGFVQGRASSRKANTAWRQASFASAALGELIAESGQDALDNGNITQFVNRLKDGITAAVVGPGSGPAHTIATEHWVAQNYLALSGGTMQGNLHMAAHILNFAAGGALNIPSGAVITWADDPTGPNQLTRKYYVDTAIANALSGQVVGHFLPLAGGTLTGPGHLIIDGNLTVAGAGGNRFVVALERTNVHNGLTVNGGFMVGTDGGEYFGANIFRGRVQTSLLVMYRGAAPHAYIDSATGIDCLLYFRPSAGENPTQPDAAYFTWALGARASDSNFVLRNRYTETDILWAHPGGHITTVGQMTVGSNLNCGAHVSITDNLTVGGVISGASFIGGITLNTGGITQSGAAPNVLNGLLTVRRDNTHYQLSVQSSVGFAARIYYEVDGGLTWAMGQHGTDQSFRLYNITDSLLNVIHVDRAGVCSNMSGTWSAISDARYKTNVRPYGHGLDVLMALRPVVFQFAAPFDSLTGDHYGLVAQDVESVLPEAVHEVSLADDIKSKTIDTGIFTWVLINAVKELAGRVQEIEKRLPKE